MSVFSTLDTLLDQRHSCRGFLDQPVERTLVERIVTTAQKVPSWCNSQPWQLIVLSTGETNRLRETLYDAASGSAPLSPDVGFPEHYQGIYKERRSDCGWQLYDAVGVAKGDRTASDRQMRENFRFFGAPHLALVTSPVELGAYGLLDCRVCHRFYGGGSGVGAGLDRAGRSGGLCAAVAQDIRDSRRPSYPVWHLVWV